MSISICLTCCGDPMLGVYILMTVTSSLLDDYVMSFFVSFNISLFFKVVLYEYCYSSFNFHLHGLTFSILLLLVCMSLELKWVSSRQHIYKSSFCIHLARLHLLIRAINPLQFSSVTQLCLTLCNPMDCSTPGIPVHHQLLELTQTHVH